MKLKKTLGVIAPGIIIEGLVCWFDGTKEYWIYTLLLLFALYFMLFLYYNKNSIFEMIKKQWYSFRKKAYFRQVPGFYGRRNVIEEVYNHYSSNKRIKTILICGPGGAGKTTTFAYFDKVLVNAPRVIQFSKNLSANSVRNKTIIFVDYAYENINLIENFIESLKEKRKKKILVVLLERTYAKEYLSTIRYEHAIDFKESQYLLAEEELANIISFNVSYEYNEEHMKYVETGKNIDKEKSKQFAHQITSRIDVNYHRPIFATIIAKLYKEKGRLNFNETTSINLLLEEYWKHKNRYHIIQGLIDATESEFVAEKDRIHEAIDDAKQVVQLLTLFCAMSNLKIEYTKKWGFRFYSKKEQIIDVRLGNYIQRFFNSMIDDAVKKHMLFILGIDIPYTQEDTKSHFIINSLEYDIVSSWLLTKVLDNNEDARQLGMIISEVSNPEIDKAILSFILRSIEENNDEVLAWYWKIKGSFESFKYFDYTDTLRRLLAELNRAIKDNKPKLQNSILNFLKNFINRMFEMLEDEDEYKFLSFILKQERNSTELHSDILKLIDELIAIIDSKYLASIEGDTQLSARIQLT